MVPSTPRSSGKDQICAAKGFLDHKETLDV
jgi:hypothetical protein